MRSRTLLLVAGIAMGSTSPAVAQGVSTFSGYVTDAGSPLQFRVNDVPVVCTPNKTHTGIVEPKREVGSARCSQRILGEQVTVTGTRQKGTGLMEAETLRTATHDTLIPVKGLAVIDRVLVPLQGDTVTVQADGYPIVIGPDTKLIYRGTLPSTRSSIATNLWLRYKGTLRPNGLVLAAFVELSSNGVEESEADLLDKNDFDASAVKKEQRQSKLAISFRGLDRRRIPAYHDPAMQARLTALGERLIPGYQRDLPEADITKVLFHFQLVDQPNLLGEISLPSGIVLVPFQVVERLPDDAQLAALLACGIAEILEKQAFRSIPGARRRFAADLAGDAAGAFLPGASVVTLLSTREAATQAQEHYMDQSNRVALTLLHDAGFDIRGAPLAWWVLHQPKGETLAETKLPYRTESMYEALAAIWRGGDSAAAVRNPPARVP